jgi:hypothetical protein
MSSKAYWKERQEVVDGLLAQGEVGVLRLQWHARYAWVQGDHKRTMADMTRLLKNHPDVLKRVMKAVTRPAKLCPHCGKEI